MGLYYTDRDGKQQSLYIGSYGIGITRAMGVIVEKLADDKGMVWPENIAPAHVYLVSIGAGGVKSADELYHELQDKNISVLYDDRDARPGEKFADAELMGLPWRVTASDRLEGTFELTSRATGETVVLTREELFARLG